MSTPESHLQKSVTLYCYPDTVKSVLDGASWNGAYIHAVAGKRDNLHSGAIFLAEVTVGFALPDRKDLISQVLATFDKVETEARAAFQIKLNELNAERQNFLALTYDPPAPAPITEGELTFFVTYGNGTNLAHCYSLVKANTYDEAREKVFAAIGNKFASMYDVADLARQTAAYGLVEVPLQPMKHPRDYIVSSGKLKQFFLLDDCFDTPEEVAKAFSFWADDAFAQEGEEEHAIPLDYEEVNQPIPPEEPGICIACNGSGEGQYDGTKCSTCGGRGCERPKTCDEEPDFFDGKED